MTVKGKSQPITIYGVRGFRATCPVCDCMNHAPVCRWLVARRTAPGARDHRACGAAGAARSWAVTAEAGLGKSRLTAEIVRLALAQGLVGYAGACQSHGTHTSYLVWQPIWRDFFALDASLPSTEQLERLRAELMRLDPSLEQRMPLLGPCAGSATIPRAR